MHSVHGSTDVMSRLQGELIPGTGQAAIAEHDSVLIFWPAVQRGQASMSGLSGVVDAQLGRPLDKTQQCSAWHLRPLSHEQVRVACVAPPRRHIAAWCSSLADPATAMRAATPLLRLRCCVVTATASYNCRATRADPLRGRRCGVSAGGPRQPGGGRSPEAARP